MNSSLRALLIACLIASVPVLYPQVAAYEDGAAHLYKVHLVSDPTFGETVGPPAGTQIVLPDKTFQHFPALTGRVVDEAEIIEPGDAQALMTLLATHESATTNQIVVVTVKTLGGMTIEHFSVELGNYWGIGQREKNNGALFVVAPVERKVRIEVGLGLQDTLTDAIAKRILGELVIPRFRSHQVSSGIVSGTNAIIMAIENAQDRSSSEAQRMGASTGQAAWKQPLSDDAVEDSSPERLAYELVEAYNRDDSHAIQSLIAGFDESLNILFESGKLERVIRLVHIVLPSAAEWAARTRSCVDWDGLGDTSCGYRLGDWKTLEALSRNQLNPTRIMLVRSIANDMVPLHISVEGDERQPHAQIYHVSNTGKEWIGETPQYVILSPGPNRLILHFPGMKDLGVGLALDGNHVRVDGLEYNIDPADQASGARKRAEFEFVSSTRRRYPIGSVLPQEENGLQSFVLPSPAPPPQGGKGGGPVGFGHTTYRKIQIKSDPTGAAISINGEPRGITPRVILVQLPKVQMVLRKAGFLETASEISLTEEVTIINVNLNPVP